MTPSVINAQQYTDRSLIEAIVSNFFIIDYGFIQKVNADKTIDVTHAKRPKSVTGQNLPEITTRKIEVLTISGKGLSIQFDYERGDKVLLLGLKDYIPKVGAVTIPTETKTYIHYQRETMKAIPLSVFSDTAKVVVKAENGSLKLKTQNKIELNGNTKQFVTWTELNTALSTFLTQLTTALTTTPIAGNGAPQPTWTGLPTTIDISAAKTTTVVTGG